LKAIDEFQFQSANTTDASFFAKIFQGQCCRIDFCCGRFNYSAQRSNLVTVNKKVQEEIGNLNVVQIAITKQKVGFFASKKLFSHIQVDIRLFFRRFFPRNQID
jgi:hypothetical protein